MPAHPHEFVVCQCGTGPDEAWERERRLPQIGQTWICSECGYEVYEFDVSEPGESPILRFRPVSDTMAANLLFFDVVGRWPDTACEDLYGQGVERQAAIDYHIVEREGLSQSEWARRTQRDSSTVSRNVSTAREQLTQ